MCIGFTSSALFSTIIACVDDPLSPSATLPDAGGSASPDAAKDSTTGRDASADAAVVAVDADVSTDFSTLANPNGAWTYGYSRSDPTGGDAGAFVVYTAVSAATPDIAGWYDPANVNLGAPAAWRNTSAVINTSVAPGEFAMHPGMAGEYAIVRWTAPAAGSYAVTLQFKTGDTGDTNGFLVHNGVALVTEATTSTEAVHELEVALAAGDHLDVAVGSKGDFSYDSTPVHLTIRSAGSDH